MGPVVGSRGSKAWGCLFGVAMALQAALLVLMLLFWLLVVSHPSSDPEDARESTYAAVSLIGSLVAFGGLVAASLTHWPRWLLVAAAGVSLANVVAAFATGVNDLVALTILLAVLPSGLLLVWGLETRGW
jgi:hypothetical protein